MATARMSTDIGESRAIESMLGIAVSQMRDSYLSIINDFNCEQLKMIKCDSYTSELMKKMGYFTGDSVSLSAIEVACEHLAIYLHCSAQDKLLCNSSKATMKSRLSMFFATTINAIKDKLHLSSNRRMMKSDSTKSFDELLKSSTDGHLPPTQLMWDSNVGDHILAQVSSVITSGLFAREDR